jgi:predicted phage terminase large subunit-like protein
VIIVATRWHEDDLVGRLVASEPDRWRVISLPALAEHEDPLGRAVGEPLWPARYPTQALEEIRRSIGAYWWSAQYQQHPSPAGGGVFQRDWFRTYTTSPTEYELLYATIPMASCRVFTTVDLAVSTSTRADYTVIATWAVTPDSDLLLIDLDRRRLEAPDILPALQHAYDVHRPAYIGVERAGFQLGIIQEANRAGLPIREILPDADKYSRSLPAAARMEAGKIAWPASAPWRVDLEQELLAFPCGRHDDIVDCLSYAVAEVARGHLTGTGSISSPADLPSRIPTSVADALLASGGLGASTATDAMAHRLLREGNLARVGFGGQR